MFNTIHFPVSTTFAVCTTLKKNLMFTYLFERVRVHKWGRDREREGDMESQTGSQLQAVISEPDRGLSP